MTPSSPRGLAEPPAFIGSDDDVEDLRVWALAALAGGDGVEAVGVVAGAPADDEDLYPSLIDVETEIRVRAGIATDDPDLVLPAIALGDADHVPHPRALVARGVGADWLARLSEAQYGRSARFHQGRPMLSIARSTLGRALAAGDVLTSEQAAEATATLTRLYAGAWRTFQPRQAAAIAAREVPAALFEVRDALAALRADDPPPQELVMGTLAALAALARACEPAWPALGGPWWSSPTFGLVIDVADPCGPAARHRFALADCYLELEDLPAMAGLARDPGRPPDQLARVALGIGACALAHAARSGLVG